MMRSGYNNGGLLGVSRCSVFARNSLSLLEYTDCYLWYLVFVSNFGMCYICTVSYRIVLRAYRDMNRSLCIGDIPVCRCIVSALLVSTMPSHYNMANVLLGENCPGDNGTLLAYSCGVFIREKRRVFLFVYFLMETDGLTSRGAGSTPSPHVTCFMESMATFIPWCDELMLTNKIIHMNVFLIISQHWDDVGSWNPSLWMTRVHLSCMVNIMLADALGT